jgi:hypothetical protein
MGSRQNMGLAFSMVHNVYRISINKRLVMILYKYLHPDRLSVLRERKIRFTQPGNFNDPFEFRPRIESLMQDQQMREYVAGNFERLVDEELNHNGALLQFVPKETWKRSLLAQKSQLPVLFSLLMPEALNRTSFSIDKVLNQSVGILCLSEIRDSLLMWGHYADNHRGLVIGFDSDHPFFNKKRNENDEFGYLRKVDYRRQRPNVVLSDTTSAIWFESKSEHWAYEQEWRIVRVLAEATQRIEREPFPICLFDFPCDSVKEIVLGMRSTALLVQETILLARNFPCAKILKAQEHSTEYGLIMEPVTLQRATGRANG